jgi:hypothetical protein
MSNESSTGGPIYWPQVTAATLNGNPAMVTLRAANGYAYEWVPVSSWNPGGMGALTFRYGFTDACLPWWPSAPRYPFASGQTLQLKVWVLGYSQSGQQLNFYFCFNVKAPKY